VEDEIRSNEEAEKAVSRAGTASENKSIRGPQDDPIATSPS